MRRIVALAGAVFVGCVQVSVPLAFATPASFTQTDAAPAALIDAPDPSFAANPAAYQAAIIWGPGWDGNGTTTDIPASNSDDLADFASALDFRSTTVAGSPAGADANPAEDAQSGLLPAADIIVARALNATAALHQADPTDDWSPASVMMASLNVSPLDVAALNGTAAGTPNVMSDAVFGHPLVTTDSDVAEPASGLLVASGLLALVALRLRQS